MHPQDMPAMGIEKEHLLPLIDFAQQAARLNSAAVSRRKCALKS